VLAATAAPAAPQSVAITRPSDALAARAATTTTFTALFVAMSGVALLIGALGVANVLVVSVLERRSEIGLRRALGATRREVGAQFVGEAIFLSTLGGVVGIALGALIAAAYSATRRWPFDLPPGLAAIALLVAVATGALAGVLPAYRAAGLAPTDALRAT
jgi:putative ABC transport system permease protein